ncbi:hypothetical protein H0H81_006516, partial [Sphagnurus paluster]
FDEDNLQELTSWQAMLECWTEYVKATDSYILIGQVWIGGDVYTSSEAKAQVSPEAIMSTWLGDPTPNAPTWVRWACDDYETEVISLEEGIRGMSRLARNHCNAAV